MSNSPQAWRERLGLGLLAGGALTLYLCADSFTLAQQVLLGGGLALGLAILLRRRWFTLVGPVLLHDMVRTARRSRFALYRLYAYFVLVLLAFFFAIWYGSMRSGAIPTTRETASFAQGFFYSFLGLQVVAVCVLAPGYLAGVITEEKESRTLEYLLATDLRNREIVLGKLGARLANLMLMLLTGLPIVSLIELMGGVEPLLVMAGFAVAAATALGLGGISVVTSVYARKTRTALVLTYLTMVVYLMLSLASMYLYSVIGSVTWSLGPITLSGGELLDTFTAGNPFLQMLRVAMDFGRGARMAQSVLLRLRDYALFHGVVGAVCVAWAVLRLRAVFLRQADQAPARIAGRMRGFLRPKIGSHPMIWKEVFVEDGLRLGRLGKILLAVFIAASFLSLYSFVTIYSPRGAAWQTPYVISIWSQSIGGVVACLLLLGVAVRAATSLIGERDRQTLDGLLAAPLKPAAILFGKWLGSVLGVRLGWLWLGVIWAMGYWFGVWHVAVVPVLVAAWLVYAAFLATVGLWFSLVSRTSLRATVYTLGSALVMATLFLAPLDSLFPPNDPAAQAWARWLYQFQLGLSPPAALGYLLPFPRPGFEIWHKDAGQFGAALFGLAVWLLATAGLWCWINVRFRKRTNR